MTDLNAKVDVRFEIRTGALVVATDGEVGRADGVIVSPDTGAVDGLVVRAVLQVGHDLLIPIEAVEDAVEDLVKLRLTVHDLKALPALNQHNFTRPSSDWPFSGRYAATDVLIRRPGPPVRDGLRPAQPDQPVDLSNAVKLRPGQSVVNGDGEVGPLEIVLLDATTGRVSHVVVRRGGLAGQDTIVPAGWISEVHGDQIVLDATREQLDGLAGYRPDHAITNVVQNMLWYRSSLPQAEVRNIKVEAVDGVVELGGYASTERGRMAIETIVRGVSGVLDVRNDIRSFESLSEAAHALNDAGGSRGVDARHRA
jgi:sporulation protein YlmC with PRC-barrel domain